MHRTELKLTDINDDGVVIFYIRHAPSAVLLGIVLKNHGDIEVGLKVEDCKQVVALLERATRLEMNCLHASDEPVSLAHRFINLDGEAQAVFLIAAATDSLEITVERLDEGSLSFRSSFHDVEKLISALKHAMGP